MRFLWKLLAEKNLALLPPQNLGKKETPINVINAETETSRKRFPVDTLKNDPYILRYKALNEKLSLFELGYTLYHIANHRGTASIRSFLEDDEAKRKENTKTAKRVKEIKKIINSKKYRTFGEYLYKEKIQKFKQNERKKVTNRETAHNNNKEFAVTRDIILEEVEKILSIQKEYYKDILNDDYIEKIKNAISYETEKLIPEPENCPYFKNEKKLPRSHKLNEYRRIYEALNNARYSIPVSNNTGEILSYEKKELSKEQKEILFKFLLENKNLTQDEAKQKLNLPDDSEVYLQGRDKKNQKIKGYALINLEKMSFWSRLSQNQQDEFLYDWNSLPDEKLKDKLKNYYKLVDNEINETFQEIVLSAGYADVGKSAMEILLNYIKNGSSYPEALDKSITEGKFKICKKAINDLLPYYGKILRESTQPIIGKPFSKQFINRNYKKPNTNKDEEVFGKIANPVVHQTLNELRKIINEIIFIFGRKPLEIGLETARELKKSRKDRENIIKQQEENEKNKNKIYEKYIEPNLRQINKRQEDPKKYILKFKLCEEQNFICPFCLKKINCDDVINSHVDIEHIFPIEESEDNSKNNLCIAHNKCNADKAKKSPFDAFGHKTEGKYIWNNILANAKEKLPHKAWRFYQDSFENFLEKKPMPKRFETDNSYISKISTKYLACLFDKPSKVFCVKPSLTAQLRIAWELNEIMKSILKSEDLKDYENKKTRIDNRHHALDAIVIAYANRGYHNFLNRIHAKGYKINYDYNKKNWLSKILLPPENIKLEDFKSNLKEAVLNANVNVKHDHNINGQLVKDTAYTLYPGIKENEYIITTLKPISEIKFKKKEKPQDTLKKTLCRFKESLSLVKNQNLRKKLEYNIDLYKKILNKDNLSKAKKELEKSNLKAKDEGKKSQEITDILIYKKACDIIGKKYIQVENRNQDKFFTLKKPIETETGFGYDTGDNLSLDLYHDKMGKLCGEIIRKIDFNKNEPPNYKKEGYVLLERIYQGDTLETDISKDKNSLRSKISSAPNNRTFVKVLTFTEVGDYFKDKKDDIQIYIGNLLKSKYNQDDSFRISSMQKFNIRKVTLTPLGFIKYRSRILKNKEK
uniref:CRISPR-associated endonuclease Cas9 n=1 Tax=Candidatus Endomicrobium sp. MdMp-027 TaxID=1837116 RepID=A0A1C9ZT79_9BACT|nr:CRISPR-associated protein Cas9 [Candidatus Endomicrobium sp. MdMp-027]